MLANVLVFLAVTAILCGSAMKILIDRKNGIQCTGCPYSRKCKAVSACSDTDLPPH